jgi:hypothetical protein
MSVETDIAEIKQGMVSLIKAVDASMAHNKEMCIEKHKDIVKHLEESPRFRDIVLDLAGKVTVLLAIVMLLVAGVLGIAWVVIQKVMA